MIKSHTTFRLAYMYPLKITLEKPTQVHCIPIETFRIYSSVSSSFRIKEQIPSLARQKSFREAYSAEHSHKSISTAQAVDHQRHMGPTIHSSRGTLCPGQIPSHTSILPPTGLCLPFFLLSLLKDFSTIPLFYSISYLPKTNTEVLFWPSPLVHFKRFICFTTQHYKGKKVTKENKISNF